MQSLSEAEPKSKGVQLDLFDGTPKPKASTDPLAGLLVKTPDQCRCGSDVAVIGAGTAMHRASLNCRSCGKHRGWLSKFTADWIEAVARKFGAPEIITLRGPRL
jgi:hypothetical protein